MWSERLVAVLLAPTGTEKRLRPVLAAAGIELELVGAPHSGELAATERQHAAPSLALSYSGAATQRTDPLQRAKALGLPLLFLGAPAARGVPSILGSTQVDVAFEVSNSLEIGIRARKLLQRGSPPVDPPGVASLDWRTREVRLDGTTIKLTVVEMALLERLLERAGSPVTTQDLSQRLRALGSRCSRAGSMVAVYTAYLRRKLHPVADLVQIRTVRRVGYCLEFGQRESGTGT